MILIDLFDDNANLVDWFTRPSVQDACDWLTMMDFNYQAGYFLGKFFRKPVQAGLYRAGRSSVKLVDIELALANTKASGPLTTLIRYLHSQATVAHHTYPDRRYASMEHFLLFEGAPYFVPRSKVSKSTVPAFERVLSSLKEDQCYVEGIALNGLPLHHAWVSGLDRGIEVLWDQPGVAYWGVPFSHAYASSVLEHSSSVLRNWHDDFSLLDGVLTKDVWSSLVGG